MSLNLAAPISITKFFAFVLAFIILNGIPISLLKFFIVADELKSVFVIIFVVVVFPLLPVIPILLFENELIMLSEIFLKALMVLGV